MDADGARVLPNLCSGDFETLDSQRRPLTPAGLSRNPRVIRFPLWKTQFGAPLETFEVGEAEFATYDGVLQIGLPPRRIDILNRASGITFDEALAGSEEFDLEGRSIRVIGLASLIKNKTTAAREQDFADIKALQRLRDPER